MVLKETMKDISFGRMRENIIHIVVIQKFNLVFVETAQGTKVEVMRVFIAQGAVFDFCPLVPVVCLIIVLLTEVVLS
jgi:hypothetical protein